MRPAPALPRHHAQDNTPRAVKGREFAVTKKLAVPTTTTAPTAMPTSPSSAASSSHPLSGTGYDGVKERATSAGDNGSPGSLGCNIAGIPRIVISDYDYTKKLFSADSSEQACISCKKVGPDGGIEGSLEGGQAISFNIGDGCGAHADVEGNRQIDCSCGDRKVHLPSFDRFADTSVSADAFGLPVRIPARCRITIAGLCASGSKVLHCDNNACDLVTYANYDKSHDKTKFIIKPFDVLMSSMLIRRDDGTHGLADAYELSIELEVENEWPSFNVFQYEHASSRSNLILESRFQNIVDMPGTILERTAPLEIRGRKPVGSAEFLTVKLSWLCLDKDPGLRIDTDLSERYGR
ncbi:uncharacterized protein LMH87_007677 [Akanthomyces muscarius]|uniref:Uncharacterized protein n=1 Tax=Akanthomyces muscarius TaxID=2231603 RepID=A0A9W8URJ1_AKAMU|nr:uncharacterized protein LMH87_007677 [Akanthomyces muscarius]KAJ4161650.1 hypothetical protein LMH87_007677 [Akanthomyces muscarius]